MFQIEFCICLTVLLELQYEKLKICKSICSKIALVCTLFTGRKKVKTFGMMKYLKDHIFKPDEYDDMLYKR